MSFSLAAMKVFAPIRIVFTCALVLAFATSVRAQGGIYNYCDPDRRAPTEGPPNEPGIALGKIVGDSLPEVRILFCSADHWVACDKAVANFRDVLGNSASQVSEMPLWNMDIPVTLKGTLRYGKMVERPFAAAGWRVCFQDAGGKPWYFQWDPAIPAEWKKLPEESANK